MRFWMFVIKNVTRRRVRSALTIIGMAIAVGAVVALVGISHGFEQSFLSIYQRQKVDLIVQRAGAKQRLTSVLKESVGNEIARIPGVKQVNSGLVDQMSMDQLGPIGVLVQGWQADSVLFDELKIIAGHRLEAGDRKGVLLGKVLAANLEKNVGDSLHVFENEQFKVIGTFEGPSVYDNGMMVMLLPDLQHLMGRSGEVTGFTVVVEHPQDEGEVQRVRLEIESLGKHLAATPTREFVNQTPELQLVRAMAWITSVIALVIGAVGMLNTMIMSVFERTKEIGILRAIGWSRRRVVRMVLMESVLLSVCGGVLGTVAAIILTRILSARPAVAGMIDPRVSPDVILQGFIIAILVGLLGAAYPAYRGAQLLPTEALRHE